MPKKTTTGNAKTAEVKHRIKQPQKKMELHVWYANGKKYERMVESVHT